MRAVHIALLRIRELYRIEREIRGRSAEERRIERQARAGPILDALHGWLTDTLTRTSKKETLGVVLQHPLNRWALAARTCYRPQEYGVLWIRRGR